MKKFFVAILAVLYLGTSVGATVHLHYCMGKLVNWSLWQSSTSKCSKCGMEKNHTSSDNGCCKDEQKHIKNSKDQKLTETAFNIYATSVVLPISNSDLFLIKIPSVTEKNPISHAPPRRQVAIYIRNRVF